MNKMGVAHGKWWQSVCSCSRWAIHVVCLVSLLAMTSAETAMPPNLPCEPCVRGLVTTVWGFIITLISLTVDGWGTFKNVDKETFKKVVFVLTNATLNPLVTVYRKIVDFWDSLCLSKRLQDMPLARPYIKILSGCDVFVNVSPSSFGKLHYFRQLFLYAAMHEDFSDALRISRQAQLETFLGLKLLTKEVLIRGNVLPPIEQLKILQGQSGYAIATIVIQAIGYMYGVIVRLVQGIHVSPIEAIAFILNLVVLMKGMWHFYSSTCHRPLILFLNEYEEEKFICEFEKLLQTNSNLQIKRPLDSSHNTFILMMGGIIATLFGSILMFFIIKSVHSLPFMLAIPLAIGEGSVIVFLIFVVNVYKDSYEVLLDISIKFGAVIILVSYIFALVVTINYWNSVGFNIQSSNYLSHILPYIG